MGTEKLRFEVVREFVGEEGVFVRDGGHSVGGERVFEEARGEEEREIIAG